LLAGAARSLVVEDALADPAFAMRATTRALGIGAYSGVPLHHADGRLYGTLCTLHPEARPVQPGELELLALAGRLIVQMVDRDALRAAERRRTRDLATHAADLRRAAEVSAAVAMQTDLGAILDRLVRAAARGAGLRYLSVLLSDAAGRTLAHAASVGLPAAYTAAIDGLVIGPDAGTCGAAADRSETVITEDLRTDPAWDAYRHLARPHGYRAVWSVPLLGEGNRVLGTLGAYQTQPGPPTAHQREALELYARLAAVAVESARARAREERLRREAVERAAELTTILEQIPDGVIALDHGGGVRLMNASGRRLAGPVTGDGRPVPEHAATYRLRDAVTGQDLAPAATPLGRALAGEAVHGADLLARGPADGADRYVRASAVPLYDTDGSPTGAVAVFADVTRERTLLRDLAASEERLRAVYHAMACGVIVLDGDEAIVDANEATRQILGLDLAVLRAEGFSGLRRRATAVEGTPPGSPETAGVFQAFQVRQPVRDIVVTFMRPDGAERCVHLDIIPLLGDDGRLAQVVLSFIDVTARTRAEAALRTTEERMRTVVSNAPVVLFALDRDGVYTLSEGRGLAALGLRPGAGVGSSIFEVYRSVPPVLAAVRRALGGEAHTMVVDVGGIAFETRYTPLYDAEGVVTGVIGVATDVTERQRLEEELRHCARHDALTGLPNRTVLHERLREALGVGRDDAGVDDAGVEPTLALLLLDLDGFKEVNDTLGHAHGDALLQQVAARLTQAVRPVDMVARLGGDEFALVVPVANAVGAEAVATALGIALEAPFLVEGHTLHLGASIGIALGPAHGRDGATLLRHADVAMYAAKRGGGGGYAVYAPAQDAALPARLSLIADLRRALAEGALVLHYQPQVAVDSGRVVGVEALARWPHPTHGFVPPDQFIPLAEGMGLIGALTDWALDTALRQCRVWRDAGHALVVAVNLSAATLHDPRLPATIARLLRAHGIPAGSLRLEVTESALMADPARAGVVLAGLAEMGVGISVDDYGTGYSSLAYLKRLPVDELKIDRAFVRNLTTDEADRTIVASTIGLGHSLGLTVVAEGVEDAVAWATLAMLGCDAVQGYHLGRPMPAAAMEAWLSERDSERQAIPG